MTGSDIQLPSGEQPGLLCCSTAPAIIGANNPELSFEVAVKNKKENAYNARLLATFSDTLYYSSVFPTVSKRNLLTAFLHQEHHSQESFKGLECV